jgi:hypothetical protein
MITQVLYGWHAYNPKNDDRCPWGLVWDRADGADSVRCCQKKRGHKGPHRAVFEDKIGGGTGFVRVEWAFPDEAVGGYFKRTDKERCEECEGAD